MNRYPDLSNTGKARILCKLFPSEIPAVLGFIAQQTEALLASPAHFKPQHDQRLFCFERLLSLAKEVKSCVQKGRRKDAGSLFISLFDGYKACYTGQLLIRFSVETKPENDRFAIAVRLLFMV